MEGLVDTLGKLGADKVFSSLALIHSKLMFLYPPKA